MENNSFCHLLPKLLKWIPYHNGNIGRASLISGRELEAGAMEGLIHPLTEEALPAPSN